jgi:hypothetical protein
MSLFEVIAAMLCISHLSQMDNEEYSLGQEDKIVVIEDVADSEDQEVSE